MNIATYASLPSIHNYDDNNDYGYFCDPSKPGSPFIKNKYNLRAYSSYPSYINPIGVFEEATNEDKTYEKTKNKMISERIDKYIRGILYSVVIVSSMTITWLLNEYKII